ncbi:MAG: hypothetical protein WAZ12_02105 [Candidatus Absconditicoccaceae bacterium]
MKDIIKRSIITILALIMMIYLIYSYISGVIITNSVFLDQNSNYYIILILIFLYTAIIHGVYPIHIKINKPVLFFIGIVLIFIGKTVLNNDGQLGIYFGDISIVIGVIIALLSPTNILIPQKIINKKKSKKVEVIEV